MRNAIIVLVAVSLLAAALPATAQGSLAANAGPDRTTNVGTTVSFDGSGSTGNIASYHWAFGDGNTANGVSASHSWSSSGVYTVTLTVTDTDGNTDQDTATITVQASDNTKPSITHTNVTSATPGQAITIRANVTDNVGVRGVKVYYKNATMGSFQSTDLSLQSGNTWQGSIPSSVVDGASVSYYLRAEDTASNSNVRGYPNGVLSDTDLAVDITLSDTTAPTITHTAVSQATAGQSISIEANITDTSGVASATLYYKKATGSYASASLTASGDTYSGSIPSNVVTTDHVQYYIETTDSASGSNTGRSPAAAPGTVHGVCVGTATKPTISVTAPSDTVIGTSASLTLSVTFPSGATAGEVSTWAKNGSSWEKVTTTLSVNGTNTRTYSATLPGSTAVASGLKYYVRANATASGSATTGWAGCSVDPNTIATVPAQPTLSLGASSITQGNNVSASWTDVSASYYHVQRQTNSSWSTLTNTSSTSATVPVSGLSADSYTLRVVAYTGASQSNASETVSLTIAASGNSGGGGGGGGGGGTSNDDATDSATNDLVDDGDGGDSGASSDDGSDDGSARSERPAIQATAVQTAPRNEGAKRAYTARVQAQDASDRVQVDLSDPAVPVRQVTFDVATPGSLETRVEVFDAPPADAPTRLPSGVTATSTYVTIEVTGTGSGALTQATVLLSVPRSQLRENSPGQLVVLHGEGDDWTVLETTLEGTGDPVLVRATTPDFSPFSLGIDTETPTITDPTPAPGSSAVVEEPTISADWSDNRGIDLDRSEVLLDGEVISAELSQAGFVYRPDGPLSPGEHTVTVNVYDASGFHATETWSFSVFGDDGSTQQDDATSPRQVEDGTDGGGWGTWVALVALVVLGAGGYLGYRSWDQRRRDQE